jgi:hypothetical protein
MPVILPARHWAVWLGAGLQDATAVVSPGPAYRKPW